MATRPAPQANSRVIDHWDRVGDWSQQWLNLRYVTRFLVRVGAKDDAAALHHALLGAVQAITAERHNSSHRSATGRVNR